MIQSAKQYEITKRWWVKFTAAVDDFDLSTPPPNVCASAHQACYDSLVSMRDDLAAQLRSYEAIAGDFNTINTES